MRVAGLVCGLRHLKFVHLSERKSVCGANAFLNKILHKMLYSSLNLGENLKNSHKMSGILR